MTIRELRKKSRMSQADFSTALHIPLRTLQEWEQGRRTPADYITKMISYMVDTKKLDDFNNYLEHHNKLM